MTAAPEVTEPSERDWVAVCPASAIPRAYGVAALLEHDVQVAIFHSPAGEFLALSNVDPLSGAAVLSRGIVGDASGVPVVASPIYKQRYALHTGVCLDDEDVRVASYPVRVVDGVVQVSAAKPVTSTDSR